MTDRLDRSPLILLVEDNEPIRHAFTILLEDTGYRVGQAGSGAEALEVARSTSPNLILMDLGLPDMSGLEVAERLARSPSPAVVLTSSRDPRDFGPRLARSGARGFIPKNRLSAAAIAAVLGGGG